MESPAIPLEGRRVLVLGTGMTGRSAARFCADRGASVVIADERTDVEPGDVDPRAELRAGAPFPDPAGFDLVVTSPGVPRERWADAREAVGDVELAARFLTVPIVAVTGTNGKSTTVRLVEAMLHAAGLRAEAAGNVGAPVLELVGRALDVAVIEVSSFQLEAVDRLHPRVAIWLNATPDHLDRHGDFDTYVATKARLLRRQGPEDVAILNRDDPAVRSCAERTAARVWWLAERGPVARGGWIEPGAAWIALDGPPRRIALPELPAGVHPTCTLAALLAVAALGADPARAAAALLRFPGLPHRTERVGEHGGVVFVNDSKATNPGATAAALTSTPGPLIWIAGGRGKGLTFGNLASAAEGRVRLALLIGESAGELAAALDGRVETEIAEELEAAVGRAAEAARPGETVLLSPACASFDQFRSFEHRGERFRQAVAALAGSQPSPRAGGMT